MKNIQWTRKTQILSLSLIVIAVVIGTVWAVSLRSADKSKAAHAKDTQITTASGGPVEPTKSPAAAGTPTPTAAAADPSPYAIAPQFLIAADFNGNGFAIVSAGSEEDPLYGIINEKGEYVLPPEYYSLDPVYADDYSDFRVTWVQKYSDFALLTKNCEIIRIPGLNSSGNSFDANGLAEVRINDKWGFVNEKGQMVIDAVYDAEPVQSGKYDYNVLVDKKWGVINTTGDWVVSPQYDAINSSSVTGYFGVQVDSLWGFAGPSGNLEISAQYDGVGEFSVAGYASVMKDGKWGMINQKGEMIVDPQYDDLQPFNGDGLAVFGQYVTTEYGYDAYENGVINIAGDILCDHVQGSIYLPGQYFMNADGSPSAVPLIVTFVYGGDDSYYMQKLGLVTVDGDELFAPQFSEIGPFGTNHLARVLKDGKYGYINESGKIVIPIKYDFIDSFDTNGLARVAQYGMSDKWGLINEEGKLVVDMVYDAVLPFADNGLAAVMLDGKCGYINTSGDIVIQPQFDWAKDFASNGLAEIQQDGKTGYINASGAIVITPQFQMTSRSWSTYGTMFVMQDSQWGLINEKGEYLVQPRFDSIEDLWWFNDQTNAVHPDVICVRIAGKGGLMSMNGDMLIEPIAENNYISVAPNGLAAVEVDGKWGYIQIPMQSP